MATHLPVPDVGGQHLVLLVLREDEHSVRMGALTLQKMGRAWQEGAAGRVPFPSLRTHAEDSPH